MIHQHPCLACGWKFPCTCNDPNEHSGLCFECAAKASSLPAEGISPPDVAPRTPCDQTSLLWASWEVLR